MAVATQEAGAGRTPGYPYVPEETWWRLRKQFKKGQPKVFNDDYVINTGLRESIHSANNLVRPLKRLGLFDDDGKPTPLYWDWMDDSKYRDACQQMLLAVYPDRLTDVFTSTDDEVRERLVAWFQRNQGVQPKVARQYAAVYILLLEGDVSKQDDAPAQKPPRPTRIPTAQVAGARSHASRTRADAQAPAAQATRPNDAVADHHEEEHHAATPGRSVRGFEPSLNINVQIHIPAEASPDQIDQIFRSMAKHLYQRHDGAGE